MSKYFAKAIRLRKRCPRNLYGAGETDLLMHTAIKHISITGDLYIASCPAHTQLKNKQQYKTVNLGQQS